MFNGLTGSIGTEPAELRTGGVGPNSPINQNQVLMEVCSPVNSQQGALLRIRNVLGLNGLQDDEGELLLVRFPPLVGHSGMHTNSGSYCERIGETGTSV